MTTTREAALPLTDAPKDHTMLWLMVDYSGDGANPLEDEILGWTIGHNGFDHTGVDEWEFAGWSWEQDCFTQGVGNVVGWYPLQRPDQQPATPATEPQGLVQNDTIDSLCLTLRRLVSDAYAERDRFGHIAATIRVNALHYGATNAEVEAMISGEISFVNWIADKVEARPAPQPAADTRVVSLEDLKNWRDRCAGALPKVADEIRAIIGTATPAPSDKTAEAARGCLPETYASGVHCKTCGQSWGEDGPEQCPNAALAGKGE